MKKLAASIVVAFALLAPTLVSAQPMIYPEDGLNIENNAVPVKTQMGTENSGFDWKWILPLALLPLLYLAFKKGEEYEKEYQDKYSIPMAGVRGGEATSEGYEDERLGWHDDNYEEEKLTEKEIRKTP